MRSDHRISYWRKGQNLQNFGDLLSELLFDALCSGSWLDPGAGQAQGAYDVIHLVGSVISDWHIERDLEHVRANGNRTIAFWGCGKRDDKALRPDLAENCSFLGTRGPLSRDLLGLPPDTPLGDPGLLVPLIYRPRCLDAVAGRTICIPHFLERLSDEELARKTGADLIIRPNIPPDLAHVTRIINSIAGARFVLSGALHAAIVACAFEVPFAFFDSGFIDVPFKWEDFSALIGVPCRFASSVSEGWSIYQREILPSVWRPSLSPLLDCCPLKPSRKLIRKAAAFHSIRNP